MIGTINEKLGKRPVFELEDFPGKFGPDELLGLDKPRFELVSSGQSLLVPKLVYFLHEVPGAVKILADHFNLDINEDNFGAYPKTEEDQYHMAILLLLGVKSVDRIFFNIAGRKQSPALKKKKENMDSLRKTFQFRHPELFPKIHELLKEIKSLTGLEAEELFNPGRIPIPFEWNRSQSSASRVKLRPITLEEALVFVAQALSGTKTYAEIAEHTGRDMSTVRSFLINDNFNYLSDKLLAQIKQKRKSSQASAK